MATLKMVNCSIANLTIAFERLRRLFRVLHPMSIRAVELVFILCLHRQIHDFSLFCIILICWQFFFALIAFIMRIEVLTFLKYGLFASALLLSTDVLYSLYLRQKNRLPRLNEVNFVMSADLPCCAHTSDVEVIKKCRNPHCKARLSRKIIEHIDSAKHLICIAM